MDTKHEALELADALDGKYGANYGANTPTFRIASELIRRQQARIEELERVLRGAANYIDKLGGVSQSYRALLTKKD